MKGVFRLIFLMALLATLPACGGPSLTMNMAGLANVNPDQNGRPSPVLMKMYELSGDLLFKNAELLPLFQDPINTLGAELVSFDEITLVPGEAKTLVYLPSLRTTHIGVVASFRRQDQGEWKIIKAIDPEDDSIIALELSGAAMLVIPDKKAKRWDPVDAVESFGAGPVHRVPPTSITDAAEPELSESDLDSGDNFDSVEW